MDYINPIQSVFRGQTGRYAVTLIYQEPYSLFCI